MTQKKPGPNLGLKRQVTFRGNSLSTSAATVPVGQLERTPFSHNMPFPV